MYISEAKTFVLVPAIYLIQSSPTHQRLHKHTLLFFASNVFFKAIFFVYKMSFVIKQKGATIQYQAVTHSQA